MTVDTHSGSRYLSDAASLPNASFPGCKWQGPERSWGEEPLLPARFEVIAAEMPEAEAVVCGSAAMRYGELNRRANRLARYLASLGAGPERLVAVCLERSLDLVTALLGVLKAGAAYVPLDPEYPRERLAFMLADSGAGIVLTHSRLRPLLEELPGRLVCMDSDWDQIEVHSGANLRPQIDPQNLSHVIYTSGSTGKAKGVEIRHGSVGMFLTWAHGTFSPEEFSGMLAATSVCFDLSVFEIMGPLTCGGRTFLAENALRLPQMLRRDEVVVINTVPSAMSELLWLDKLPSSIKTVNLAGEALSLDLVRRIFAKEHVEKVYNLYGPTEDTTYSTFACFHRGQDFTTIPIGAAITGTQGYVLDESMGEVPAGVSGELYLGGAGLARGYLGRGDLTAERFVPSPFGLPGERLYRTGDQVRRRGDGQLEYLGRLDHQVKLRGYRIELGEIEVALREQAGVRESVVAALEDGAGGKFLVGYVVLEGGVEIGGPELRRSLETRLPEYMVPSAVVVLEQMPLTPNGKIDRKGLPRPESRQGVTARYLAPRGELERAIAALWGELLGIERVGSRDNFFELGGHSLLAMRVISRLERSLEVDLDLRTVFTYPTVSALAEQIEEQRAGGKRLRRPALRTVERAGGEAAPSYAQQRLWFLERLEPGQSVYNIPSAVRLRGRLDRERLQRALAGLAERHETLRTHFAERDGEPVQVIAAASAVDLRVEAVTGGSAEQREAGLQTLLEQAAREPLAVAGGRLWRALLVELGAEEHVLLLNLHHGIADGWSLEVLWRELGELYEGRQAEPLSYQYADYAAWQREWLATGVLEEQMAYWKQELAGMPGVLTLPSDRPRSWVRSHHGGQECLWLEAGALEAARQVSRREGTTLFMTLLACYEVLLGRYAGQEEFGVGVPIANRRAEGAEGQIGLFVNTLVQRADLRGRPSFGELLQRVRNRALQSYMHQDLPFEQLVEQLQPERSLSHTPLFQVMFDLQPSSPESWPMGNLEVFALGELETGTAKCDLTLLVQEHSGRLRLTAEYSTALFDGATVRAMLGHYGRVLEEAARNPERGVWELDLLTAEDRRRQAEWQGPERSWGEEPLLPARFEVIAAEMPEAEAVVCGSAAMRYGELNRRANQLARYLASLGAGPETLVAVCLERSLDLVTALLGVLKAGAAYVPLDPEYPRERLAFMLADSGAGIVLTHSRLRPLLEELPGRLVLELDQLQQPLAALPGTNLNLPILPLSLAYMIYTSGSTGTPKGALNTHAALANLVYWHQSEYGVTAQDRASQVASLAFDASVWEIWPYLTCGATLCMAPTRPLWSAHEIVKWLQSQSITLCFLPTPLAEMILREASEEDLARLPLRALLTGGDKLNAIQRALPFAIYNHYGPTENTVVATAARIDPESPLPPPIGAAITGTQGYVLDESMGEVPAGVSGELYLGGAGLARGYLGRGDLTAERFVPSPFGLPGERLYRTGDQVRRRGDGQLEYLGRLDHQVKLRGYRIELGEIEVALREQAGVRESVVAALEDGAGGKFLVGYVVLEGGVEIGGPELRRSLETRLPEYMVPSAVVVLEQMPLTPNGKIDRKGLPRPESRQGVTARYLAPRGELERAIAALWGELLGIERVGSRDNFFELGGHSLLAMRVISRLERSLEVDLDLRTVFTYPTVSALAEQIEEQRAGGKRLRRPALRTVERAGGEAAPSYAQQRLWFLERLEPGQSVYNIPSAVRLRGRLDRERLQRALAGLAERHETLRTHFAERDGEPVQVIAAASAVDLRVEAVTGGSAEQREAGLQTLLEQAAREPLAVAGGRLWRALLVELGAEEHVLLLNLHHGIADGWSLEVLWRELGELYEGRQAEPLSYQYADYAAWQREWLATGVLEEQMAYWKQELAGMPGVLTLPSDRPRSWVRSHHGGQECLWLEAGALEAARQVSRREGTTLFMTLLACYEVLLGRYAGQEEFGVGVPIANRRAEGAEGQIGLFVNTLVQRADLRGRPSFGELLQRVRNRALQSYMHQDLPFEQLVEQLQPERSLSHTPLFQVMFDLQPSSPESWPMGNLEVFALGELETGTAKCDLTLLVQEHSGRLRLTAEYSTALFDGATVRAMLGHYGRVLEEAARNPERGVWELDLLTAEDRRRQAEWQGPERSWGEEPLLPARFEVIAAEMPEAEAVVCGSAAMRYGELNRRANQLARYLASLGAGPETLVAVCLERSLDLVTALLGVLKAGAAYVPLDPEYPRERLAFMLADSGAGIVLTHSRLRPLLEELPGRLVLELDQLQQPLAALPGTNLNLPILPLSLAYMIYTSGSTGTPKGALNTHAALANRLLWMQEAYQLRTDDCVLQKTPFSFDVSVWEFFWPLIEGARLVMAKPGGHRDPEYLAQVIVSERVTTIHFVPSMLGAFLQSRTAFSCPSLRRVICSGEALSPDLTKAFYSRFDCQLHNLYGPTEAAIDVTHWPCEKADIGLTVPIGRPIANISIHILDSAMNPVPRGVQGELYIGGIGVGRGYLGRSDLTAERFLPDPFGASPGARLYRTGDRGYYRPNGDIEFCGRIDYQIKIRGNRIELGEIEAVLRTYSGVREAVVAVKPRGPDDSQLVAYLLPAQPQSAKAEGRYVLPNGLSIFQHNKSETDFLYREIYESQSYTRHVDSLPDNACVFDVGANIGLFALYIGDLYPNATIYAFEPLPPLFETLRRNAALSDAEIKAFPFGIFDKETLAEFTYYRGNTMMSGLREYADLSEDVAVVKKYLSLQQNWSEIDGAWLSRADELLEERMKQETFPAQLRRISDIMREQQVEHIDLLKIDVERAEWNVLQGIDGDDWPKIDRIVLEVHDRVKGHEGSRVDAIRQLLSGLGYQVSDEEDQAMRGSGLYNLYAVRPNLPQAKLNAVTAPNRSGFSKDRKISADITPHALRGYLRSKLPEYMIPDAFVTLEEFPLTASGKIDRKSLPSPDAGRATSTSQVPPRTNEEQIIAEVWRQLLHIDQIGVHDNFFELGGHSLLVLHLQRALYDRFGKDVGVAHIFHGPTIRDLAELIASRQLPTESAVPAALYRAQLRTTLGDNLRARRERVVI